MSKRDKETITLGSGLAYILPYADSLPTQEELFQDSNLMGYTKGGAALEYTETVHEEKDDLNRVSKIITTDEEALLKLGLLTWNGNTLKYLIDRCKTVEENGKRITKIGGSGNAQGGYYAVGFHHEDKVDGDLWVMIKGRNTAGATLTFATDNGTKLEPSFKALPHDKDGTLIELIEELDAAAAAAASAEPETEE